MGNLRVVLNGTDSQAVGLQCRDRALAPGTGALDVNFDLAHPHALDLDRHLLGRPGSGERRGLSRTLEPDGPGRVPGQRLAGDVGDRDHRVVERRPDMGNALDHVLSDFLLLGHFEQS